jgi:hypothetical protein
MPRVVVPDRVGGRVLPWHGGEQRQGEDRQEVTGRPDQGDPEGTGVGGGQARDPLGLAGTERRGADDQVRVLPPG